MKVMLKRKLVTLLSVIGLVWAAGVTAQVETLKIGVVSALTGPGAAWGLAQDGGMKIAVMEANAKGGLKVGNKTYKIEVISYDDEYKAALAVTAVTRLIEQDKVKFVMGPLSSASMVAVNPLYEKSKTLAFIGGYSDKALNKDSKYVFRLWPTQVEFTGQIVDWLKKNKPALKTVVQFDTNDESGWGAQKLVKQHLEGAAYKILSSELFERGLKDFQPALTRILPLKPDIIAMASIPPGTAGLVVRQARELGFKGQFVNFGGPGLPQIVAAAGKEFAEGMIFYAAADSSTKDYKDLEAKYAKVLKPPMNEFTVYAYDISRMLLGAIQAAGTVEDTDKVRGALEKMAPYKGIQGIIRWGGMKEYGSNHQMLTPIFIGMAKNGEQAIMGRMD